MFRRCFAGVFNGLLECAPACAAQKYTRSKRKYNRLTDRALSRNGIGEDECVLLTQSCGTMVAEGGGIAALAGLLAFIADHGGPFHGFYSNSHSSINDITTQACRQALRSGKSRRGRVRQLLDGHRKEHISNRSFPGRAGSWRPRTGNAAPYAACQAPRSAFYASAPFGGPRGR